MITATSADVIVYPDGFENPKTGAFTFATPALPAALRWLQTQARQVADVRGVHGGFSVCDTKTKASTVAPWTTTIPMVPITLVQGDKDAEIGSVQFWRTSGSPGPFAVDGVPIRASALSKFCVLVSQHLDFPDLALDFKGVEFRQWSSAALLALNAGWRKMLRSLTIGDGPGAGGYLWSVRAQGRIRSLRAKGCVADGPGEWMFYVDDFEEYCEIVANICSDAGRGMVQLASRQFEDKLASIPTGLAKTPESAHFTIRANAAMDCSSYPQIVGKPWMANGSALTVAGMPCNGEIVGNRISQTHAGGGGISVWDDKPKVGNHRTSDGFATGDLTMHDNIVSVMAGAAAGREAIQVGGCRSLSWKGNTTPGTEKRVVLNHTAPIGSVHDLDGTLP